MKIGFHCSHEQFSPRDMLAIVKRAEQAGFQAAMCADHITPWSVKQGQSGATWSWLGAALEGTSLPFGSLAIPGGWRYHPVVLAHMIGTLAQIYPGRLPWVAVGSGEAMNERVVGQGWPDKEERHERLYQGAEMMRALWRGETLNLDHGPLRAENAKLWSLPDAPPAIIGAALTADTAAWLGGWADGMITVQLPPEELAPIIKAFHDGGGAGKKMILQMHVSWAESDEEAEMNAWDQWRSACLDATACGNLTTPEEFDRACADIKPEDMHKPVLISSDIEKHIAAVRLYREMGFDEIYIHNSGRNQMEFLAAYEREFFPAFKH